MRLPSRDRAKRKTLASSVTLLHTVATLSLLTTRPLLLPLALLPEAHGGPIGQKGLRGNGVPLTAASVRKTFRQEVRRGCIQGSSWSRSPSHGLWHTVRAQLVFSSHCPPPRQASAQEKHKVSSLKTASSCQSSTVCCSSLHQTICCCFGRSPLFVSFTVLSPKLWDWAPSI